MVVKGFRFSVCINSDWVGFQSVMTNGDDLVLEKHSHSYGRFSANLPGKGLITITNKSKGSEGELETAEYFGTFKGYGISVHPDDPDLAVITLMDAKFPGNVIFQLDATKL